MTTPAGSFLATCRGRFTVLRLLRGSVQGPRTGTHPGDIATLTADTIRRLELAAALIKGVT